jgi:hypothetical protein
MRNAGHSWPLSPLRVTVLVPVSISQRVSAGLRVPLPSTFLPWGGPQS